MVTMERSAYGLAINTSNRKCRDLQQHHKIKLIFRGYLVLGSYSLHLACRSSCTEYTHACGPHDGCHRGGQGECCCTSCRQGMAAVCIAKRMHDAYTSCSSGLRGAVISRPLLTSSNCVATMGLLYQQKIWGFPASRLPAPDLYADLQKLDMHQNMLDKHVHTMYERICADAGQGS